MEFAKFLKYGSAVLFLVLVGHGLVLGFSAASTVICCVLAFVTSMFEAQLVKSEREEQETRMRNMLSCIQDQINNISKTQREDKEEVVKKIESNVKQIHDKIDNTDSKIQTLKISNGMRKV